MNQQVDRGLTEAFVDLEMQEVKLMEHVNNVTEIATGLPDQVNQRFLTGGLWQFFRCGPL